VSKYKPSWELRGLAKPLCEWINPIKKGSNKFRYIMSGRGSRIYRNFKFDSIRPIRTLWEQMQIDIDEPLIKCGMLLWRIQEVDTDFRQYMFKWNQGMVQGNTVISHFGDVDRKCSFCKIKLTRDQEQVLNRNLTAQEIVALNIPDETRPHIYWECPIAQEAIQSVHTAVWGINNISKKDFLMGKDLGIMEVSMVYMLVNMYIKHKIWKYKLANVLPNTGLIIRDVQYWIEKIKYFKKWRMMLPLVQQLWNI
jgi:hypothetical protein